MRFLALLLTLAATATAQTNVGNLLEQGMRQALAGATPVPESDKAEILKVTAELLAKHVTFRPDGTASSFSTSGGERRATEWKKLVVRHITMQAVTEADQLNGISKRYLVSFGCDAHRTWDAKFNSWGQWYPIGNVTFPSAIYFEWKNGAWMPAGSSQLKFFTPGSGPSIAPLQPAARPDPNSTGLPPGMTRARSK